MTKLQYLYNTYVSLYFTIEQKHNRALFILLILLKSTNINEMLTFIYFTITMYFVTIYISLTIYRSYEN